MKQTGLKNRVSKNPPAYIIKYVMDEPIQGTFYVQELQKVGPKEDYTIEKIVEKQTRKGHVECKVKFKG